MVAATTTTAAAVLWARGQGTVPLWLTAATPLTLVALSLAVVLARTTTRGTRGTRGTRHRERSAPVRPARRASERHNVPER